MTKVNVNKWFWIWITLIFFEALHCIVFLYFVTGMPYVFALFALEAAAHSLSWNTHANSFNTSASCSLFLFLSQTPQSWGTAELS